MSDKLIPYAATRNEKTVFDWNQFLAKPAATILPHEMSEASRLADNWITCACGNQCSVLPRYENAAPKDGDLYELGNRFSTILANVKVRHFRSDYAQADRLLEMAREVLEHIELRSTELLMEMAKKELQ